ncbi:MAG: transcriptional regulator [Rhizobiaceae bacterium]
MAPVALKFCASATLLLMVSVPALAAELIMFEQDYCEYCERWNEEVGVVYHKTVEGKRAPLRRLDIHGSLPEDLAYLTTGAFTPTFVLVDKGKEVGRIRGYPGEDFFWGLLGQMLKKLPEAAIGDG